MKNNKHPIEIKYYEGEMDELVDFIVGQLRYDKVVEFHQMLADRYLIESENEKCRSQEKLTEALAEVGVAEQIVVQKLKKVWEICEPYTE